MKCPRCGHENRKDAHFCQSCGTLLIPQTSTISASKQPTKPLAGPSAFSSSSSASPSDTRPLPNASVNFAPLPKGALLHNKRYVVVSVNVVDERLNIYGVEDNVPVRLCPNCRSQMDNPYEQFCSLCGADLSGVESLHLRYLVRESQDEHAFATESRLLEMRLEHPGLLLPHEFFIEAPYGPPRRYLVEQESPPPSAASLAVPQELAQVLKWGISLAQALDYLHRHQIVLREISLSNIAVDRETALWTHLDTAYIIPQASYIQAAGYFSQNVRGLATVLFYLVTGRQQYTADARLPKQLTTLFSQVFGGVAITTAAAFATALEAILAEIRRPTSVTLLVGRRTDVGQERSLNEDSMLTVEFTSVSRSISIPVGLFVVADGMGGHEAGDVASNLTVRVIAQQAVGTLLASVTAGKTLLNIREWLTTATQAANRVVYDQRRAASTDMGTTLVMALFTGDTATVANVGDSRAYLLKQDGITQITTDHSLVERLVTTGQITPEEAKNHPQKNVIYRVIGDKPRVKADLFEQRIATGEALLLCSDGLSGMVSDEQIWQIWRTSTSPQEACDRMVEAANLAGGEDNITVVIVQIGR